jgi:tRNA(Arg) A34 adenosine deaminase TadA
VLTPFEQQVLRQVERLSAHPPHELEAAVAAKRVAWFAERYPDGTGPPTPRRAYEVLLLEYLGLAPQEVPVVSESERDIAWRSTNPCPTLDACRQLGLDTRSVCRRVYEKSTQALVSQIDPQLRFLRSYERIRPHADHCAERIVRVDFERLMRLAIEEASCSRAEGNKGYGAVVVLGDRILVQAHDTAVTAGDPSRHAEVNAIRAATSTLGTGDLCGAILLSTCEPCPMCASLAVWANVSAIIYGASIAETAAAGRTRIRIDAAEVVEKSPALIEVIGGVLHNECLAFYR